MNIGYISFVNRLIEGVPPRSVACPSLREDVVDTLGALHVLSATEARLTWQGGDARVLIDRETRIWAAEHVDALWAIDLHAVDGNGTIAAFRPTRVVPLDCAIPVRCAEDLAKRLEWRGNDDFLRTAAIGLNGRDRVAVFGQQTLAALDDEDAAGLTLWLKDGSAVEFRIVDTGAGDGYLEVVAAVPMRDAATARCGPNVLVRLGAGAALLLDVDKQKPSVSLRELALLRPPRSELFDAWARYTQFYRKSRKEREAKRSQHPIEFRDATALGKYWRAKATMSYDAIDAWLGSGVEEERQVKLDQPVACMEGDRSIGEFVITIATLRGPALVDLVLENRKGTSTLPTTGRVEARADKGEEVRLARERDAVDALTRGLAGCERLPQLLYTPESATPPRLARLPRLPREKLDVGQLRAVELIVGCQDIVAIQGPPGTGKTRVIAEALEQIAHARRGDKRETRVLVSSVQNEAVSNVLDRMANVPGIAFSVIQRKAKDEDQAFEFTATVLRKGKQVVADVRKRAGVDAIERSLKAVDDAAIAVERIPTLLAVGLAGHEPLAAALERVAATAQGQIGGILAKIAVGLAARLRAPRLEAEPVAAVQVTAALPADPTQVPGWWAEWAERWPVASRAHMAAATSGVAAALALPATARELVLKRKLVALTSAFAATTWPGDKVVPTEGEVPSLGQSVLDWVADALKFLRDRRKEVLGSPTGVALEFVHSLEHDSQAWASIVGRHSNMVAATCSKAADAKLLPGQAYDWVIIDEAGRASPFELLIPMVQGRRIVLIGDHRQLPPTVDEAIADQSIVAGDAEVDIRTETLFGSIYRLLPDTCRARLATQYRMHGAIGELDNRLFYAPEGEPVDSFFAGSRAAERRSSLGVFRNQPLVWQEVAPGPRTSTEQNLEQAQHVVRLLRRYAAAGAPANYIALICPYRRQGDLYRKLLQDEPELLKCCQVKTIDAVQGREYPVVILDLVRTDGRAGFLASPNRLNVAISRAQLQLVVVGAASQFRTSSVQRVAPQLAELVRILRDLPREEP